MRISPAILLLALLLAALAAAAPLRAQQSPVADMARSFETEVRTKVEAPFAEGLSTLCKRYTDACAASLKSVSTAGLLDDAIVIKKEMESVSKGGAFPVVDPVGTHPELAKLRAIWRQEAAKLQKERDARMDAVLETYQARVQRLVESLTRQGSLADATQAKDLSTRHQRLAETLKATPASFAVINSVFETVNKLTLKMKVDGSDIVKVRDGRLWIEHGAWQVPSGIVVNGAAWSPAWTGKNSEPFGGFNPALAPFRNTPVTLKKEKGRSAATILEQPSSANGNTLAVKIDDGAGGSDEYEVLLTW